MTHVHDANSARECPGCRRIEDYRASVPRRDDWGEATCVGYFGYGNGRSAPAIREMASATEASTGQRVGLTLACNSCRLAETCWEQTKERARQLMPTATRVFHDLARQYHGPRLLTEFTRAISGQVTELLPDPYFFISTTNMAVGLEHETGDKVDGILD